MVSLIGFFLFNIYLCKGIFANCYYPNGTDANSYYSGVSPFKQCNLEAPVSMCCNVRDQCRKDGLCLFNGSVWRNSCTERTWRSSSCIKLCVNSHPWIEVTPCGDGSYCCGGGPTAGSCCENGEGVWIKNGEETLQNPSLSNSTLQPSSPTTETSTATSLRSSQVAVTEFLTRGSVPTSSAVPTSTARTGSQTKSIVGGTVGGLVGLLILCSILGLCWLKRRTSKPKLLTDGTGPSEMSELAGDSLPKAQLHGTSHVGELWGHQFPHEEIDSRTIHEALGSAHHHGRRELDVPSGNS